MSIALDLQVKTGFELHVARQSNRVQTPQHAHVLRKLL